MRTRLMRLMAFVFVAMAFGLTGGGNALASEKELQVNALASASRSYVDDDGRQVDEYLTLEVLTPGKGFASSACLTVTTFVNGVEMSPEEGCAEAAGSFVMDQDQLSAATLASVQISLITWVCEGKSCEPVPTRTVSLSAEWTATAPKVRINEQQGGHEPTCDVVVKFKGFARDQSASISIDGLSTASTGNLQWFEETQRCK